MRRAFLPLCLLALAGCGSNPESKFAGVWHVDQGSVQTSRLTKGFESNADWTDATAMLSKIQVTFTSNPNTVTSTGFGLKSTGTWSLRLNEITVRGAGDHWPKMAYDPNSNKIHLTIEKEEGRLQMDLVKGSA